MMIQVKMFAEFRQYAPAGQKEFRLELKPGATAGQTVSRLGLPPDLPQVVLINGRREKPDTVLKEGDMLTLFPLMEGG
ncbi:MAG: MoaD/ThiS family protein [Desulfobacterales bacterium]|nr:MoaD/ThiS family protein [Desulfobacterales bacterium]